MLEYTMADLMKEIHEEFSPPQDLPVGKISEVDFVIMGLELEHEQRKFVRELKDKSKGSGRLSQTETTTFAKRREALAARLESFFQHQVQFMPGAVYHRTSSAAALSATVQDPPPTEMDTDEPAEGEVNTEDPLHSTFAAEDVDLLLPSSPTCLSYSLSSPSLTQIELRIRQARLEVHLTELRRLLRVKAGLNIDKRANSTGQKAGTRSTTALNEYAKKIERQVLYYNEERKATLRLDASGEWQHRLKVLEKDDARPINVNAEDNRRDRGDADRRVWRESQRSISWIWKVPRKGDISSNVQDILGAEEERLVEGMSY